MTMMNDSCRQGVIAGLINDERTGRWWTVVCRVIVCILTVFLAAHYASNESIKWFGLVIWKHNWMFSVFWWASQTTPVQFEMNDYQVRTRICVTLLTHTARVEFNWQHIILFFCQVSGISASTGEVCLKHCTLLSRNIDSDPYFRGSVSYWLGNTQAASLKSGENSEVSSIESAITPNSNFTRLLIS